MTPLAKFFRETNIPSREMIILKYFRYMHFASLKKFFLRARTHKAHFMTHKYGVWISKKIKIWAKFSFGDFVPVVCIPTKTFYETTNDWQCVEVCVLPLGLTWHHYDQTRPANTKISSYFLKKQQIQSTLKNSMFFPKKTIFFSLSKGSKNVCKAYPTFLNFWKNITY